MPSRTGSKYLAPLGLVLALALGACASATSAGSVDGLTSGLQASVPSASATAGPSSSPTSGPQVSAPAVSASPVTSGVGVVVTPLPDCNSGRLKTVVPGKLTFTIGEKTQAPWFVGTDPADGRGYESAVAIAVADELGYSTGDIRWTRIDLAKVTAGRGTGFDVALGEFATPDKSAAVDYSTGYFSISDSVVAKPDSAAAKVTTVAGLKSLRVGAISGSSGLRTATAQITGAKKPEVYATVNAGVAALRAGSVDAVVLPTPAAIAAGSSVMVIGQLTDPTQQPQQFGMVLPKRSPLTSCISGAIDQLRVTGKLTALVKSWVPLAAKPLS
jgi:polar amino acid transport system substrate-binding protein